MTLNAIHKIALDLLFETTGNTEDYDAVAVSFATALISELFQTNNILREAKGLERETELPVVESLEDDIPFEPEICTNVFPYGLASKYIYDEGDLSLTNYFLAMYTTNTNNIIPAAVGQIEDNY